MCALHLQAQEREVEEKDDIFSKVRIDTIHIKATPYERVLENYDSNEAYYSTFIKI
jgi:hypothetical protein